MNRLTDPRDSSAGTGTRPRRLWAATVLLAVAAATAGCTKLQARLEWQSGNDLYEMQAYADALERYEAGLRLDPTGGDVVWRSAGLAAMAQIRSGDSSPANQALADKAVRAFERHLEDHPGDARIHELLLTTLIEVGRYDAAIERLEARRGTGALPAAEADHQIAGLLVQAGRLDEALQRLSAVGSEAPAEAFYAVGVAAWGQIYNNPFVALETRQQRIDLGRAALERALREDPDYAEAMVYMGLLLREQEKIEFDPRRKQEIFLVAEDWANRAKRLMEERSPDRGS